MRYPRLKLVAFVMLCLLPVGGALKVGLAGQFWLPALVYLLASLVCAGLYWHDKRQALAQGQRIPEKVLHLLEFLGGWPGALVGQQAWRHKTRKLSYQLVFWMIVLIHQAIWVDWLFLGQWKHIF
ncbi:DUF1294 domain-containing protein [Pseudomonas putida CSV86]|uniref:DUF1294 domain-containing protein n=1 Tax=Pseudomonas bharatica CSV86 TaxID=1005395 RepID=L1M6K8_9PSED|nr:DUF1294 domain-containing protein [Pseudomonas bharatica]NNJ15509.1 DUF1294 domain-containing protein [Pseudomonas bharatica CSV86]